MMPEGARTFGRATLAGSVAIAGPLGPAQIACLRSWRRLGGTTGKVARLGYDEPRLLFDSFSGIGLSRPQLETNRIATNRYAIARTTIRALRGQLNEFDQLTHAGPRAASRLALGFFAWRDELFSLREPGSSLAYLLDSTLGSN